MRVYETLEELAVDVQAGQETERVQVDGKWVDRPTPEAQRALDDVQTYMKTIPKFPRKILQDMLD